MTRLVYIATDPITAYRLMEGQLRYMQQRGFEVVVITAPGQLLERTAAREGVRAVGLPMRRELSPLADVVALVKLTKLLRELRPTIVNAGTPKAGLLGVLAARLAGVPVVIYLLRGLRFEGATGLRRLLLVATEHVAAAFAHRVFVNSESLKARFVALKCAPEAKAWVPLSGSSNGVDVERYRSTPERLSRARDRRRSYGIPDEAVVVGFVGRFVRDKGIVELSEAFARAARRQPRLHLLLVGDHDATDPLPAELREQLANDPRVTLTGFVDEPAEYYAMMDIFAFPSFREGFPNAVLEAAAAGLPVVAARATGTVDAVQESVTGTIVPPRDVPALEAALVRYAEDPTLRHGQGAAAAERAARCFARDEVWRALEAQFCKLLADQGLELAR